MKRFLSLFAILALAGSPVSAEVKLSEKLTRIASHLGEGGVHFSVTDSQDDLKNLAGLIDEFFKVIPDADIPPGFKLETVFGDLGLFSVEGSGQSSRKVGETWHNRVFVLTDGKHEGLLSLLGREPAPSNAGDFGPAGADLVLETTLDLRQVEKMARQLAKVFGPQAERDTADTLMGEIPGMGLTMADLFADFSVRGTVVFWLDEKEKFDLGPETLFPVPHLAARLEGGELVWSLLKKSLGEQSVIREVGDEVILSPKDAEQAPWGLLDPSFVWNAKSKELYFSLTGADLAACRGGGARLAGDPEFKAATVGFPERTNGLAYVSRDFLKTLLGVGSEFSGELPEEGKPIFEKVMPYLEELAEKGGYAAAFSVEDDGFLFVANSPLAAKGGSGLSGIATVATLAGITTPLILRAQKAGQDAENANNLKMYASAQILYRTNEGKYADTVAELVDKKYLDQEAAARLSGSGLESLVDERTAFDRSTDILAFIPSVQDPDMVMVARVDGSVMKLSSLEFREQVRKQSE